MAQGKSTWYAPSLTRDSMPANSEDAPNLSFFNSHTYLAHPPSVTLGGNITKVIMLGFDDGWKSQLTYAKPILDKYGFKASFFVVCNYVNSGNTRRMNWQDIAALQKDGMDIESHSMTHTPYLNILPQNGLDYEIGGSKQCLSIHGYNSTMFAYPFNLGSNNPTVVNTVAKYYNIGRSGTAPLMFLKCIGFKKHPQTDCRIYGPNGKLNYANRYVARSLSFDIVEIKDSFNNTKMFSDFVSHEECMTPESTASGMSINIATFVSPTDNPYQTAAVQEFRGFCEEFEKKVTQRK